MLSPTIDNDNTDTTTTADVSASFLAEHGTTLLAGTAAGVAVITAAALAYEARARRKAEKALVDSIAGISARQAESDAGISALKAEMGLRLSAASIAAAVEEVEAAEATAPKAD